MTDELAIQVLVEMLNRVPKNTAELAGIQSALKHIEERLKPKPATD